VEAGAVSISVTAPGYATETKTVPVAKGESRKVAIELTADGSAGAATGGNGGNGGSGGAGNNGSGGDSGAAGSGGTSVSTDGMSTKTVVMIAEGGLAAIGLGVGVGFALASSSAKDDRDSLKDQSVQELGKNGCAAQPDAQVCVDLMDAANRAKDDSTISTVGFIGMGVSAVALGATWLLWDEKKPSENQTRVYVDPWTKSVSVAGRF
ncbi:MAG: hypothetical protein KC776_33610, partial [Myxococcales bacterium]|nr:hypothetical protein [Myxococcales bacterium]